jgi:hypothetical protein
MIATAPTVATADKRNIELADIFERHGDAYRCAHRLRPTQAKVVHAVRSCRTAALGGHRDWCPHCGFVRYMYHSCRNRHCPKCQALTKAQWLENRCRELLPVPYFHNTFTLPHELNSLILFSEQNQRLLLDLLFHAAAQTLLDFGKNNLGGKMGFTMILHTWDQQLRPHFHVHTVIAGGALALDGESWISTGSKFLFSVRALSRVFRAKFLEKLAELCQSGGLHLPPQLQQLGCESGLRRWLRSLRKKSWIVNSKAPFSGPEKALDYLGRYTHRVAISNHRLISLTDGEVAFYYRDRRDGDRRKIAVLPVDQFIRRFLQHVLPDRFMRIRHYGFLANRAKKQALACCREQLGVKQPEAEQTDKTVADWVLELTGIDIARCPQCGAQLMQTELPPQSDLPIPLSTQIAAPPIRFGSSMVFDTS